MADYEELLGIQLDFGDSFKVGKQQYDQFIAELNKKGLELNVSFNGTNGADALAGLLKDIQTQLGGVRTLLSGLDSKWEDVFGAAEKAASAAADGVVSSTDRMAASFSRSEQEQTASLKEEVAKRERLRAAEIKNAQSHGRQIDRKKSTAENYRLNPSSTVKSDSDFYKGLSDDQKKIQQRRDTEQQKNYEQVEQERIRQERRLAQSKQKQQQAVQDQENALYEAEARTRQQRIARESDLADNQDRQRDSQEDKAYRTRQYSGPSAENIWDQQEALQAKQAERDAALYARMRAQEAPIEAGLLSDNPSPAYESDSERQSRLRQGYQQNRDYQDAVARGKAMQAEDRAAEAAQREAERQAEELERQKSKTGVGGFFGGVKQGLQPGTGTAYDLGKFTADVVRFQVAWTAVGAAMDAAGKAISIPIETVKNGIDYLSQFQEKASELKANLLDSGHFSDNPEENDRQATAASNTLLQRFQEQAAKLNVSRDTIQTAFTLFNSYGGSKLSGPNLNDTADLAAYATAALQSQNPRIQQRQVATQLQKLAGGTFSANGTDKLPAALGLSAEQLNKMAKGAQTTHDLLQQIEQAAPGLAERLGDSNSTFDSLSNSVKLVIDELDGLVAKPIFDELSDGAKQLLAWFQSNRTSIQGMAKDIGNVAGVIANQLVQALKQPMFKDAISGATRLVALLSQAANLMMAVTATKQGRYGMSAGLIGGIVGSVSTQEGRDAWSKAFQNNDEISKNTNKLQDDLSTPEEAKQRQTTRLWSSLSKKYGSNITEPLGSNDQQALKQILGTRYDQFQKDWTSGNKQINDAYNERLHPTSKDATGTIAPYTNTGTAPTGKDGRASIATQVSALTEVYNNTKRDITKSAESFRETLDQDVKTGVKSLGEATALKVTSYNDQAKQLEAAAAKYQTDVKKISGKGGDEAKKRAIDSANEDTKTADYQRAAGIGKAGTTLNDQQQEIAGIVDQGNQNLEVEKLKEDQEQRQQWASTNSITRADDLKDEQAYQEQLLDIQNEGLEQRRDTLLSQGKAPDAQRLTEEILLNNQKKGDLQKKSGLDTYYANRQATIVEGQNKVTADQGYSDALQGQVSLDQDTHQPSDVINQDELNALTAKNQVIAEEISNTGDQLRQIVSETTKANGGDTTKTDQALAQNTQFAGLNNRLQSLSIEQATIQTQIVQTQQSKPGTLGAFESSVFGQGRVDPNTGQVMHFDDLEDTTNSLQGATNTIGNVYNAARAGYSQSGAGGAIGAGLSSVSGAVGAINPIAGAAVGLVGSITSLLSGMFTQAAQNIGKEVAKAVDQVMEKYNTGQMTLNDTIAAVQAQINSLVSQESGKKGGQSVLDQELPGLQQELDSLKYQQQQDQWNFQDQTVESSSTNSVVSSWLTDWININKQVEDYQKAVGSAGDAEISQYLNEQLAQQQLNLENQYNQGQQSAINDAIQLNQLLQQRNNYEDQYREQQFQILSADSLQRVGNPAEEAARKIEEARTQYDQETQQNNYEISVYQQKVAYEQQIFGLASDTATLYQQSLQAQSFQLAQQMQQYEAMVSLLQSTSGLTAGTNGFTIPGLTTGDGGSYIIPGITPSGSVSNTDNSGQTISISLQLPSGVSATDVADAISEELTYINRTQG